MSLTQTQIDSIKSLTQAIGGLVAVPGAKPQIDALLKQISEITGTPVFSGEMVEAIKQATEAGGTETAAADPANGCEAGCGCPDIQIAISSRVPPCPATAFAGMSAIAQSHGMLDNEHPLIWLADYIAQNDGVAADVALLAHMSRSGLEPLKGDAESYGMYLSYIQRRREYLEAKRATGESSSRTQALSTAQDTAYKAANSALSVLTKQVDAELEELSKAQGTDSGK